MNAPRVSSDTPPLRLDARKWLLSCSLYLLVLIWFIVWMAAQQAPYFQTAFPDLTLATFTPFIFIIMTIIWVVLCRVVSPLVRSILFFGWVLSVVSTAVWAATDKRLGGSIIYGCMVIVVSFICVLVLAFVSPRMVLSVRFPVLFIGSILALVAGTTLFATGHYKKPIYVAVGVVSVAYGMFQIWAIQEYAKYNELLAHIDNACIFAVMAPWVETIEAFQVIPDLFHGDY